MRRHHLRVEPRYLQWRRRPIEDVEEKSAALCRASNGFHVLHGSVGGPVYGFSVNREPIAHSAETLLKFRLRRVDEGKGSFTFRPCRIIVSLSVGHRSKSEMRFSLREGVTQERRSDPHHILLRSLGLTPQDQSGTRSKLGLKLDQ